MENDKTLSTFISSGIVDLDKQLKFTTEVDKMTHILRKTLLTDGSRQENDAEHSWHIALMALIFAEYAVEKPNILKSATLCIVHDLVEIYAGDTFAFDTEANKDKSIREKQAADKLFAMLPEEQGKEIRALWEEFEQMQTVDSKFANCMDRLQPFLHNTLTGGHTWLKASATIADVENRMKPIKEFMPKVWTWVEKNIENGLIHGWICKSKSECKDWSK